LSGFLEKSNILGKYGDVRNWSKDAIFCYNRNCRCGGCYLYNLTSGKCKMKASVLELFKKFGAPK